MTDDMLRAEIAESWAGGPPMTDLTAPTPTPLTAESVHKSTCWTRGYPTPQGYVTEYEDHEPGAEHYRCADAWEWVQQGIEQGAAAERERYDTLLLDVRNLHDSLTNDRGHTRDSTLAMVDAILARNKP